MTSYLGYFLLQMQVLPSKATYWHTDKGLELHREMIVGERRFLIRSILSNAKKAKTPTEQMLHVIDSDLKKDTN